MLPAPYLGCREFPARFAWHEGPPPPCPEELRGRRDLGLMLLDLDYQDPRDPIPRFFPAVLEDGVLTPPGEAETEAKS